MRLFLPLLLCLPLAAAAGEMYRWVDKDGKVHFTQTKPAGLEAAPVAPAPPPGQLGGPPNLGGYADRLKQDRVEREQAQASAEREAGQRKQKCSSARSRAAFLKNYEGRIFTPQEDGGRDRWTPEQFAAERERADSAIAENCNR